MNLQQVKKYWVEPALEFFPEPLRTPNRKQFMVAIGLVESGYNYVAQFPEADALGYWQVQLGTYRDNILNFLEFKNEFNDGWSLLKKIHQATYTSMTSDCVFACYMGAITVYRAPAPLPEYNDIEGMAKYWKTYYNASPNGATVEEAMERMLPVRANGFNY
jgi:hypothetical protein